MEDGKGGCKSNKYDMHVHIISYCNSKRVNDLVVMVKIIILKSLLT